MRRFAFFNKVGLASVLSFLAILLGLYTTTGTASAHSAQPAHSHPIINVFDVSRFGTCLTFRIEGENFSPHHHADLEAESFNGGVFNGGFNGGNVSIGPDRVRVNGNGRFATDAEACGFGRSFNNCGEFIDNPGFFCGVNLNPEDFCGGFGFEPSAFCFGRSAFGGFPGQCQFSDPFPGQCQFSGQFPGQCQFRQCQFSGLDCRFKQECFRHVRVDDFCRFHFFSFCNFRFRNRTVELLVKAVDDHTGNGSNIAVIRFGFNF
jgi:hypothetical protein